MAYTGLVKFTNHAATTLASSLSAGASSLTVETGDGALFPSLSGGQYFYATIEDADDATVFEIVKVTARSTDTFTITKAQDSTSDQAWAAGDKVQLRLPRVAITDLETQLSAYTDTAVAAGSTNWTAPGTIGSVTPNTGKFTTLQTTGETTAGAAIGLADAVPGVTTAKLYNSGGDIFWSGSSLTSGSSKWTTVGGTNVYRNSSVRIGSTSDPTSTLDVTGTVAVSGVTTLSGLLNANAGIAVDTNKFTVADSTGNTLIAGTLQVTGASTLTGALAANGGITCDTNKFTVADTTGNTAVGGTFAVTGESTFSAALGIAAAVPADYTAKLYNSGGNLYWAGVQLQTGGSSKWTDVGAGHIYRNSSVHIGGTAAPVAKLEVSGGIISEGGATGHHVEAYGAVGDGSTNDASAIQSAINAALAGTNGSNTVVFGAKTYKVAAYTATAWLTSTAYVVGDIRSNSGSNYVCVIPHTSGTFATDLASAAGRGPMWVLLDSCLSVLLSTSTTVAPATVVDGVSRSISIVGQGSHTDDSGVVTTSGTTILVGTGTRGIHFHSAGAISSNECHSQFTLKGIKFQGESGGGTAAISVGTTAYQVDSTTRHIIEDVYSYGFTTHLDILNARQISVRDSIFRGAEWGGETNATTPLALRIQSETGFFSGDITFFNCEFSTISTSAAPTGAADTYYCAYVKPAGSSTIAGLDFQNCYFYYGNKGAIQFTNEAASTATVQDILISGCQFDGTAISNDDVTCIRIENNANSGSLASAHWRNFIITGNYIFNYRKGCYISGWPMSATSPGISHVVYSNNYVYNAVHSALNTVSAHGVTCNGNVLRHCGDSGNDRAGFDFQSSDTITVIGNTHVADGYAANMTHLVRLSPAGSYWQNCTVIGNSAHVRSTGNIIDDEDTSTNKIIFGNRAYYRHAVTGAETVITGYSYVQGDLTLTGNLYSSGGGTYWTSSNDGAGTGLDADLLDAQHGSYYLDRTNHTGTQSGSTLSGGTITSVPITGSTGSFTTLAASSTISGAGFTAYMASPPAIGSTSASTGKFTTLNATTTSYGLKVGITDTPSEGGIAAFGVSGGSGMIIGWNKGSAATPVVESGATAYVNYSGAGTGGHQFFNFTGTISNWTSTTPQLLGGWASDGAIYTVRAAGTKYNWHLMGYTVTAPAATGYVSIYIDGVLYKLLAST